MWRCGRIICGVFQSWSPQRRALVKKKASTVFLLPLLPPPLSHSEDTGTVLIHCERKQTDPLELVQHHVTTTSVWSVQFTRSPHLDHSADDLIPTDQTAVNRELSRGQLDLLVLLDT